MNIKITDIDKYIENLKKQKEEELKKLEEEAEREAKEQKKNINDLIKLSIR